MPKGQVALPRHMPRSTASMLVTTPNPREWIGTPRARGRTAVLRGATDGGPLPATNDRYHQQYPYYSIFAWPASFVWDIPPAAFRVHRHLELPRENDWKRKHRNPNRPQARRQAKAGGCLSNPTLPCSLTLSAAARRSRTRGGISRRRPRSQSRCRGASGVAR